MVKIMLPLSLALLLMMNALVIQAGVVTRDENGNPLDTNVVNNKDRNVASIVNVVLPQRSRTCRRCICTITDHCPTSSERTCLSAASLCCCCAPRSFACQGRDGALQPDDEFIDSFNEIAIDGEERE